MAFTGSTFIPTSSMANSDAARQFSYTSGDSLATVKGANYFDSAADPAGGNGLKDEDVILVTASDGTSFVQVSITAGAVTVGAANDFV